jgi:hypothetical protein
MKTERFLWIAAALLVLAQPNSAADPKCKPRGTTGEKAACVVTADFYKKHLASTVEDAVRKTRERGQRNSVIQLTEANLVKLNTIADNTGARSMLISYWPCIYGPETKKKEPTASCGVPDTTTTLYFCVKTFPPDSSNRIYHLSDRLPSCP